MERKIWSLELAGIPFIVILGSLLHFTFAWSGYWTPIALVSAVNESVWEHLKLAFWPAILWATLEFSTLPTIPRQFWPAKGFALLIAPMLIVLVFYAYTSMLGRNILVLDIITFVVAIALGQIGSAILLTSRKWEDFSRSVGAGLIACQLIAYSTFTFYPPPFAIFEDSRNGTRGIPPAVETAE